MKNGNMRVLSNKGAIIWATNTEGKAGSLVLENDGEFKVFAVEDDSLIWKSPTE
jgi:hypothetical protein